MTLASYFSSSLYAGLEQNTSGTLQATQSYAYLVSVTKSQSALEAKALSKDIPCSGYIWKEGDYYHVIHSAYSQENDATRVVSALEKAGQTAEMIKVTFPPICIEAPLSNEQHTLIMEAATSFMQAFKNINDIAVGLETSVYSEQDAIEKLSKIKERASKLQTNFSQTFNDFENEKVTALGEYLADLLECICLTSPAASEIKYCSVEILEIYKNMTAELK